MKPFYLRRTRFLLVALLMLLWWVPASYAEKVNYCADLPQVGRFSEGKLKFGDIGVHFSFGQNKAPTEINSKLSASISPMVDFIVTQNGEKIYQESLDISVDADSGVSVRCEWGLDNVKQVVSFHGGGESCDVDSINYLYAWTGEKLLELPRSGSRGDEEYSYGVSILLPSQTGIRNVLIRMISEDLGKEGNGQSLANYELMLYKWDGENAIEVKQQPIRQRNKEIPSQLE